jgi:hypothetical protein
MRTHNTNAHLAGTEGLRLVERDTLAEGELDGVTVGVRVYVGVWEGVAHTEGVTDGVRLLEGVMDAVRVLEGVMEAVLLLEGVTEGVGDGVGQGEADTQLYVKLKSAAPAHGANGVESCRLF